jgi:hypothetical protein
VIAASATGVRTVVIRPGMVYGRGGGPTNQFAGMAADGVPRHVGGGENHWTLVHVDDLADLYALAVERAPAGTLVNGVAGPPLRVRDLAEAASAGAGLPPPRPWPVKEAALELGADDADGVTRDHRISGELARSLLGWRPAARSPLDELRGQTDAGSGISSHAMPETPSQYRPPPCTTTARTCPQWTQRSTVPGAFAWTDSAPSCSSAPQPPQQQRAAVRSTVKSSPKRPAAELPSSRRSESCMPILPSVRSARF